MLTRRLLPVLLAAVALGVGLLVTSPAQAAYAYAPPSSFQATTIANTYAVMSWKSPSSTVDSFSLRYSTSSTMSKPSYRVPGKVTELQLNNLKPNTNYYLQIRARKSGNDVSDWSSKLRIRTTDTAFGPPSAPSFPADRIRKDSFKMQWGEVPNASRYRIQFSTSSDFTNADYYYTHSNENSVYIGRGGDAENEAGTRVQDDAGMVQVGDYRTLQESTRYYVRVRALEAKKDGSGEVLELTDYSSARSVATNTWAVYPPQEFAAESTSAAGITISWQDVAAQAQGAQSDSYRIQYWEEGSGARYYLNTGALAQYGQCGSMEGDIRDGQTIRLTLKKLCNLDPGNSTYEIDSSFTKGTRYRFRVAAVAGSNSISDYTDESGISALATAEPLISPEDLRVDSVTDTSMTLSWKPVVGAASYRLQQKLSSTSGSTRYLYDICEEGGSAPRVACSDTVDGRKSITLTKWQDNNTGASTTLKPNDRFYIRIAAQEGADANVSTLQARASDYSVSYVKAQLRGWPYEPPEDVSVKTHDSTSITLQWKPVNDPDGDGQFDPKHPKVRYRIQYSSDMTMSNPKYATTTAANVNKAVLRIGGLASERVYYFRIRAVDEDNAGTLSDYTEIGKPWTARTLGRVGKVHGTLSVESGCSPSDYELHAYWGDEVEDTEPVLSTGQTAQFTMDGLLVGSAYNFRYEYTGNGNCVSVWVSNATNEMSESHMLKSYATDYPLELDQDRELPTTTAFPGVRVAGTVTAGKSGPANPGVRVTAFGGPQDGSSSYREVHGIVFTGSDGSYELSGLWPTFKYKFYFYGGPTGLTGGESTYSLWKNHISASDPGTSFTVWLCNGVGNCVPDSNNTGDGEESSGSFPGGYGYPVPADLRATAAAKSLELDWDDVAGAPFYRVQYSTNSSMSGASYAGFGSSGGALTGLQPDTTYYVRVAVVESGGVEGEAKLSDYTQTPYPYEATN